MSGAFAIAARRKAASGLFKRLPARFERPRAKTMRFCSTMLAIIFALGLVMEIDFELDRGESGKSLEFAKDKDSKPERTRLCPECHCVQAPGARECPQCGHVFHSATDVREREGELIELGSTKRGKPRTEDRDYWHGCFAFIAKERGHKDGWVSHKNREKFGVWPTRRFPELREPDVKVMSWLKSRQIACLKSKKWA